MRSMVVGRWPQGEPASNLRPAAATFCTFTRFALGITCPGAGQEQGASMSFATRPDYRTLLKGYGVLAVLYILFVRDDPTYAPIVKRLFEVIGPAIFALFLALSFATIGLTLTMTYKGDDRRKAQRNQRGEPDSEASETIIGSLTMTRWDILSDWSCKRTNFWFYGSVIFLTGIIFPTKNRDASFATAVIIFAAAVAVYEISYLSAFLKASRLDAAGDESLQVEYQVDNNNIVIRQLETTIIPVSAVSRVDTTRRWITISARAGTRRLFRRAFTERDCSRLLQRLRPVLQADA